MKTLQDMVAEISKRASVRAKEAVGAGVSARVLNPPPAPTVVADDDRTEKLAGAVEYIVSHFDDLFPATAGLAPKGLPAAHGTLREKLGALRANAAAGAERNTSGALREHVMRKLAQLRAGTDVGGDAGRSRIVKKAASETDKKRLVALIRERQGKGAADGA